MRQQVADRDLWRQGRVGEVQFGNVLDDRVVKFESCLVDEHEHARGDHGLGRGCVDEVGAARDGRAALPVCRAKCADVNDTAIIEYGDDHAGNAPGTHGSLDAGFEADRVKADRVEADRV